VRMAIVSTGSERDDTILRDDVLQDCRMADLTGSVRLKPDATVDGAR